jgi:CubicO group peptidase (beta-lactamase class C family)
MSLLLALAAIASAADPAPTGTGYAWVTFDRRGTTNSGSRGIADPADGRPITIDDPVRVASISKLLVALAVMRLVEAGRIDLNADVSDALGWRLRHPQHPDVPITLRLLLSHRSGLTDGVDYVVPLGKSLRNVVLDSKAWDPEHAPGQAFRYANVGFPVIASVLERRTGERFDRLMRRTVLEPLRLDACYNWSGCSTEAFRRAVVLTLPDGTVLRDDLRGAAPPCPVAVVEGGSCDLDRYVLGENGAIFSPQGGLRISARDLTVIGRLLLDRGRHAGKRFLRPASIDAILTPVWTYNGANGDTSGGFYCRYGLASQSLPTPLTGCDDALFGGRAMVGHAGDAYGVRSGLWIDRRRGNGIAYFAVGNGPDPKKGRTSYRAVEEWLAAKLPD